ncbi:hypothetical protein [Sicyoidochytrium minutum DNA virus]|nr:hypothetical protein [Sicyoidochytrium minutum DNA virus]
MWFHSPINKLTNLFNAQGKETHVAVFRDLIQIIQILPGKTAGSFRAKAANYLCRLLAGDESLIPEIMRTKENTPEVVREVIMQDVPTFDRTPAEKRFREETMDLIIKERRHALEERKAALEQKNLEFQIKRMAYIEDRLGGLDDTDKIYFKDLIVKCNDPGYAAIQNSSDERGEEISIALVAQELGIHPREKSPQIGKVLASMWRARYPGQSPPKRRTKYLGRVYNENAYYDRDRDLVEKAIRQVCGA